MNKGKFFNVVVDFTASFTFNIKAKNKAEAKKIAWEKMQKKKINKRDVEFYVDKWE